MKNIMRLTHFSFLFLLLATAFVGCVKKDDMYKKTSDESARKQVLLLMGSPDLVAYARDVKPTLDTFVLIDLRRYPNTEAELNQPLTVKLKSSPDLIIGYDTTNQVNLIELPASSYTLLDDINNLTFGAGEAIKEVKIVVDQSKLDLSQAYALAFSVTDPGGAVINSSQVDGIYQVGVKNKYDGSYSTDITTTGWGAYGIADGVTNTWPVPIGLITSGAASVTLSEGYQPAFTAAGDATGFGATDPQYTFDPATDEMIEVINLVPDDGRGRQFHLDPAQTSYFDPATHNVYAHYIMVQNGRPDQHIDMVFTYKGPR
jgi:uncharacterized protein DUF1735